MIHRFLCRNLGSTITGLLELPGPIRPELLSTVFHWVHVTWTGTGSLVIVGGDAPPYAVQCVVNDALGSPGGRAPHTWW
jgi:hypothetical protein